MTHCDNVMRHCICDTLSYCDLLSQLWSVDPGSFVSVGGIVSGAGTSIVFFLLGLKRCFLGMPNAVANVAPSQASESSSPDVRNRHYATFCSVAIVTCGQLPMVYGPQSVISLRQRARG
jgi:hypothetical protein